MASGDFISEDDISDLLECSVCLDTCQIPILQCTNGHNICKMHVPDLPEKVCPVCRVPYSTGSSRNLLAERMILKKREKERERIFNSSIKKDLVPVGELAGCSNYCSYFKEGCTFKDLNASSRSTHEKDCDFRPITCPLDADGCNNSAIQFSKYIEHLQTRHKVFTTSSGKFVRKYIIKNGDKLVRNGSSKLCIIDAFQHKILITAHQVGEEIYVWAAIHGQQIDGLTYYMATIKLVTLDKNNISYTAPIRYTTRDTVNGVFSCLLVATSVVLKNLTSKPKSSRVKFWSAEIEIKQTTSAPSLPTLSSGDINLHSRAEIPLREAATSDNSFAGGLQPISDFARDFYRSIPDNHLRLDNDSRDVAQIVMNMEAVELVDDHRISRQGNTLNETNNGHPSTFSRAMLRPALTSGQSSLRLIAARSRGESSGMRGPDTIYAPTVRDSPTVLPRSINRDSPTVSTRSLLRDLPTVTTRSTRRDLPTVSTRSTLTDLPTASTSSTLRDLPTASTSSTLRDLPTASTSSTLRDLPTVSTRSTLRYLPTASTRSTLRDLPTVSTSSTLRDWPTVSTRSTLRDLPTASTRSTLKELPTVSTSSTLRDWPTVSTRSTLRDLPTASTRSTLRNPPTVSTRSHNVVISPNIDSSTISSSSDDSDTSTISIKSFKSNWVRVPRPENDHSSDFFTRETSNVLARGMNGQNSTMLSSSRTNGQGPSLGNGTRPVSNVATASRTRAPSNGSRTVTTSYVSSHPRAYESRNSVSDRTTVHRTITSVRSDSNHSSNSYSANPSRSESLYSSEMRNHDTSNDSSCNIL